GLFTKAYALTAAERPELRRAYLSFPWPYLYEHSASVASIAVERDYEGESAVFFGRIRQPEAVPLAELEGHLRRLKEAPVADVNVFRRTLKLARFPRFLRRLAFWYGLNGDPSRRAMRVGTFGVSVLTAFGCQTVHLLSPLTTTLYYGVVEADGGVTVRLHFDHRVIDGAPAARALQHLETVMNGAVVDELRELATARTAAKAA
ncbi:MAG: hypothetical protein ACRDD1_17710, partial [Planctomycetia bacterium]